MTDAAQARARAYSPSSMLPGGEIAPVLRAYADQSAAAYAACPGTQVLRYGQAEAQTFDLVGMVR